MSCAKPAPDLWYGVLGCGAFVEGNRVKGVVVATPHGRGVVLAEAVVDSTGNAAIAAAAGAECVYTGGEHIAIQGTGLPYWELGARYTNTDYAFIDDIDVVDAWQSFLAARKKFANRYDLGQLIDTRERRQIVGDFSLSPMDVYLDRTYPDSVVRASSNFDSHGFTIHPMFMLKPPDHKAVPCYVPYRCLLPKGIEGVLVTGLGVSAHRDVMPVIRMQPDVQNQGYAAGVAAATAAREGKGLRRDRHPSIAAASRSERQPARGSPHTGGLLPPAQGTDRTSRSKCREGFQRSRSPLRPGRNRPSPAPRSIQSGRIGA